MGLRAAGRATYDLLMSIETAEELAGLRAAGRVVAETLRAMARAVRPGVTTGELDAIAARMFRRAGARSGPQLDYGFPGATCISVADEAVHGIPGPRRLRRGDLVKLDATAELDGFYADACITVAVGPAPRTALALAATARRALDAGMAAARADAPLNAIGAAVESTVARRGHTVCAELTGHGVGRRVHEPPTVPSCFVAHFDEPLTEGLVLTIEPVVSTGSGALVGDDDGWTVRTADGTPVAQAEHTIVIRDGAPLVLTA